METKELKKKNGDSKVILRKRLKKSRKHENNAKSEYFSKDH